MNIIELFTSILSSDIFRNLIMLTSALMALIIYYLNKRNTFKRTANIILIEIREVEKVVSSVKSGQLLNTEFPILKSNTWKDSKHLFVKRFDSDEFEQINTFYFFAETLENERKIISNSLTIAIEEKSKLVQKLLIELSKENSSDPEQYNKLKNEIIDIANKEDFIFRPATPRNRLDHAIQNMQSILHTTIGIKLKKYSK